MVSMGRDSNLAVPFKWPASHLLVKRHIVRPRSDASKAMRPWALDKEDETLAAQLLVNMLSVQHNKIGILGYPVGKTDDNSVGTVSSNRVIIAASWIRATAKSKQLLWILSWCFLGKLWHVGGFPGSK
jgi:hypothetical protein